MGALASHAQQADVAERVALLRQGAEVVYGGGDGFAPVGEGTAERRLLPAHAAAGAQARWPTTRCTTSKPSARSAR